MTGVQLGKHFRGRTAFGLHPAGRGSLCMSARDGPPADAADRGRVGSRNTSNPIRPNGLTTAVGLSMPLSKVALTLAQVLVVTLTALCIVVMAVGRYLFR
jgi:hypothetical protein